MEAGVDWGLLTGLKSSMYTAAGKSGTAETERANKYHKWLIAYANRNNPEIMVVSLRLYTTDTELLKLLKRSWRVISVENQQYVKLTGLRDGICGVPRG